MDGRHCRDEQGRKCLPKREHWTDRTVSVQKKKQITRPRKEGELHITAELARRTISSNRHWGLRGKEWSQVIVTK